MIGDIINVGAQLGTGIFRHQQLMKQQARPKFENTEYGKWLQRVRTQGAISPEQRSMMMGQVGRETGTAAALGKSAYLAQGRAERGRSISLAGGAAKFDLARTREMGEAARDIEAKNLASKAEAEEMFARVGSEWNETRRQEKQALAAARQENITGTLVGMIPGVGGIIKGLLPKSAPNVSEKPTYGAVAPGGGLLQQGGKPYMPAGLIGMGGLLAGGRPLSKDFLDDISDPAILGRMFDESTDDKYRGQIIARLERLKREAK